MLRSHNSSSEMNREAFLCSIRIWLFFNKYDSLPATQIQALYHTTSNSIAWDQEINRSPGMRIMPSSLPCLFPSWQQSAPRVSTLILLQQNVLRQFIPFIAHVKTKYWSSPDFPATCKTFWYPEFIRRSSVSIVTIGIQCSIQNPT